MTPAAVCQCFTLVTLCTSIADPNWIQIQNQSDPNARAEIYGVTFTLHTLNRTHTGALGGPRGWALPLLFSLAALCYAAVLLSSASFLLDFLGAAVTHWRLVTSLHVSTALSCAAALGVCGTCLSVIGRNVQGAGLRVAPGESMFIQMLGLLFCCGACVFSLRGPQPLSPAHSQETQPLIGEEEPEE